jgi:cytochrome c
VELAPKCLDIEYGSQADKARLVQWTCNNENNQNINHLKLNITTGGQQYELKVMHSNSGIYRIRSVLTGKCLDIEGASMRDRAKVVLWECHEGANQKFRFTRDRPTGLSPSR